MTIIKTMEYQVVGTFGVSAIVSFAVSTLLLLFMAAKRGYLRIRAPRRGEVLLPRTVAKKMVAEMTPLNQKTYLISVPLDTMVSIEGLDKDSIPCNIKHKS